MPEVASEPVYKELCFLVHFYGCFCFSWLVKPLKVFFSLNTANAIRSLVRIAGLHNPAEQLCLLYLSLHIIFHKGATASFIINGEVYFTLLPLLSYIVGKTV